MGYLELVNKHTSTIMEIRYIQELMKKDKNLDLARKLVQLREEQKYLARKINVYNGVENE